MGLFAAFLNIVTTVHTGDDASFVYEFIDLPSEYVPLHAHLVCFVH
jgi:hypothetical protein